MFIIEDLRLLDFQWAFFISPALFPTSGCGAFFMEKHHAINEICRQGLLLY